MGSSEDRKRTIMSYTHVIFFKSNQDLQRFLDAVHSLIATPVLTIIKSHERIRLGDPFVILQSEDPWSQQEAPLVCQFHGILYDDFNRPQFEPERYGMALAGYKYEL